MNYVSALAQRRNAARTARAPTQGALTLRSNRTPPPSIHRREKRSLAIFQTVSHDRMLGSSEKIYREIEIVGLNASRIHREFIAVCSTV
jgi:hypothetical protein